MLHDPILSKGKQSLKWPEIFSLLYFNFVRTRKVMIDAMPVSRSDSLDAQQAPIMTLPPPCFTVSMSCLCLNVFGFKQTWLCELWPNILTIEGTLVQKSYSSLLFSLFLFSWQSFLINLICSIFFSSLLFKLYHREF